jgi:hypothetical protein
MAISPQVTQRDAQYQNGSSGHNPRPRGLEPARGRHREPPHDLLTPRIGRTAAGGGISRRSQLRTQPLLVFPSLGALGARLQVRLQ